MILVKCLQDFSNDFGKFKKNNYVISEEGCFFFELHYKQVALEALNVSYNLNNKKILIIDENKANLIKNTNKEDLMDKYINEVEQMKKENEELKKKIKETAENNTKIVEDSQEKTDNESNSDKK